MDRDEQSKSVEIPRLTPSYFEDKEAAERFRDALILALDGLGNTYEQIGHVVGLTRQGVHWRLKAIPQEVREYFRDKMEGLAPTRHW